MKTDIKNYNVIFRLNQHHISADFFHSAEGDNADYTFLYWRDFICDRSFSLASVGVGATPAAMAFFGILVSRTLGDSFSTRISVFYFVYCFLFLAWLSCSG